MKANLKTVVTGIVALGGICILPFAGIAAEDAQVSVTVVPASYISVKGDADQFRAQHWKNDGYSGGLEDIVAEGKINKDTTFLYEGHAFPGDNDFGGNLEITKEELGFFKAHYSMFRKYYDGTGGVYYPFTSLSGVDVDQNFRTDNGHMGFEIGGVLGNLPELSLFYDQHTKDGVKSRLSWTGTTVGATTRSIGPSWQDIDETVNSFGLRAKGDVGGFNLKGEQKWQFLNEKTMREERLLSTNSTASQKKLRRQYQDVDTDSSVTTLRGEKWFWKDTGMLALAYRYSKIENKEGEEIREYDEYGNPRSFSSPKNKFNATADNKYTSNIVTGNFQSQPIKDLIFNTKLKTEIIGRRGGSRYPSDTTDPPNSIPNTTDVSMNHSRVQSWGGDFGLRYSGIKKTSVYGDVEVGRVNNWIYENRDSIAGESASEAGEVFFRETNVYTTKVVLTAGTRSVINKYLNFTTQVRHKQEDNDYDDIRESSPTGSSDKSAFFDFLQVGGTEYTTKWTVKPVKKVTGSMRYQYADNIYVTRTDSAVNQRALTASHTFTYDVILEPIDRVLLNLGYMRQLAKTSTPAGNGASPKTPGFTSNVNTWMMSAAYIISPKMSVNTSFSKASQDNFDDFTATGLPYGMDASWYDASAGLRWMANKTVSVEPKYTYYNYQENPKSGVGGYSAHEIWMGVHLNWF